MATGFLRAPEELRARKLQTYYAVLNEDPDFARALQELSDCFPGQLPTNRLPPPEFRAPVTAFVVRWRLPRDLGSKDLWQTIRNHRLSLPDGKLKLTVWSRGFQGPGADATIFPNLPLPFSYDPGWQSHSWLVEQADRIAREVRDSIIRQGEDMERVAAAKGWRVVPPRHRDGDALRRMALRLYRYAVLDWTDSRIANCETDEGYTDSQSVYTTVHDWARDLDIPLPDRRPGPKPRNG